MGNIILGVDTGPSESMNIVGWVVCDRVRQYSNRLVFEVDEKEYSVKKAVTMDEAETEKPSILSIVR